MLTLILESALRSVCLGAGVWLVLRVTRTRSPRFEMLVWTLVLLSALAMPILMHRAPVPVPATLVPWQTEALGQSVRPGVQDADIVAETTIRPSDPFEAQPEAPKVVPIDWWSVAEIAYGTIALGFLLRLALGLALTQFLRATAKPFVRADVRYPDVKVSSRLSVPMTFGRIILVPPDSAHWSTETLAAILAHERSHLDRGDFFILLLAAIHRALFWISPLSWWLARHLARLAETISDEAAIQSLGDRPSYAEILLDVASKARRPPFGVAMARHANVSQRLDHILGEAFMEPKLNWRRKAAVAALVMPMLALAAGAGAQDTTPADPWQTPPPLAIGNEQIDAALKDHLDAFVGTFSFDPRFYPNQVIVFHVEEGHLYARLTGGSETEVIVRANGDFIYDNRHMAPRNAEIVDGKVRGFDISWRGHNSRLVRVDDSEARHMDELHAQRLAEQAAPMKVISVEPQTLDQYVGYFKLYNNKVFTITRYGSQIFNTATGENRVEIFPYADRSFFYTTSPSQLTFEADSDGHINMAVRHWDGWVEHAPRITEAEAKKINTAFQDRLEDQRKARTVATIDPAQFDKYIGTYQLFPRVVITTSRDGDKYFAQATGQRKTRIYPENDHSFFYTIAAAQISFETDTDGKATKLVLHQNGWEMPAERIEPISP